MSKKSRAKRNQRKKTVSHMQNQPSSSRESAMDAAKEVANDFQDSLNEIRAGRERVGYKLSDRWDNWYNNLMIICFTLGGALIAVATAVHFGNGLDRISFWLGDILLLGNGLYILLHRKRIYEVESSKAITMGYEIEYYSMVARNRVQDILRSKPFKQEEYESAKDELLRISLEDLDKSYDNSRQIDIHMDVMTIILIASIGLLAITSVKKTCWLIIAGIGLLIFLMILILFFRSKANEPKEAIKKRDEFLEKLKEERKYASK
jgi:hypothetical protein